MKTLLINLSLISMAIAPAIANDNPLPPEELARRAGAPTRDYALEDGISERAINHELTLGDWNYVMARMPRIPTFPDWSDTSSWYFGCPAGIIATISMALIYQPGLVPDAMRQEYLTRLVQRAGQGIPYIPSWTQPLDSGSARKILDGLEAYGITL